MNEEQPAVRLERVARSFEQTRAVDDVTFAVRPGEVFGLLGHNGAGKTTLIRLVDGLLRPDAGSIRTLGLDPLDHGEQVRARTGVLTEYPALDDFLTPMENLAVYAAVHGVPEVTTHERAGRLVERLGLLEHATQPARALSAGLKQRLALARAMIHDPELLLLDEPTSNLDPLAARGVRDLVLQLAREHGRTVVLSTHNLIEAQALCDRVAIIQRGRLLACGTLDELGASIDRGAVHVTVAIDEVDAARRAMTARGATDIAVLAGGDTVAGRLARADIPDVVATLVRDGVHVRAVVPQLPSLEDVYVALHDGRHGHHAAPPVRLDQS